MLNKFFKTIHIKYYSFFRFIFFLRYLFLIFLVSVSLFLIIPNFFNFEKRAEIIKKNLLNDYNLEIVRFEKIEFKSLPLPSLVIENAIIDFGGNSTQSRTKKLIIYPDYESIYNDKKFQTKKIIFNNIGMSLRFSELNLFFRKLLDQKNKIFLKNLNIKIKDKEKLIFNLNNIKFANYGYNKDLINGSVFGKKFKIVIKNNAKILNFKLLNTGINADINFEATENTDTIKGVFKSKILSSNIKFNFDYDSKILNIYNSYFRSKNISFNNESLIIFNPFLDITSKFNIEDINPQVVKKLNYEKLFDYKKIIKKINSKNEIIFKSKKFDRNLIDELDLKIELAYGTLNYQKRLLISKIFFQCDGAINLLEEFPLLFFDCFVNTKNKKKLLEIFSIKSKDKDKTFKLNTAGNLNILNNKINFKTISTNNNYTASKEDLIYYKEAFEDILFDKSFLEIFKLKKIKSFLLNVS